MNIPEPAGIVGEQTLFTVRQICAVEPGLNEGGMRHLIFHAESNGLAASGAIVRIGRKILIHRKKMLAWLESGAGSNKLVRRARPTSRG